MYWAQDEEMLTVVEPPYKVIKLGRLGKFFGKGSGLTLIHLDPGAIGVRFASIASADGLHRASDRADYHGSIDYAWWQAHVPQTSFLILNKDGLEPLLESDEALRRMLLCPPILKPDAKTVHRRCYFNLSDCDCEVDCLS